MVKSTEINFLNGLSLRLKSSWGIWPPATFPILRFQQNIFMEEIKRLGRGNRVLSPIWKQMTNRKMKSKSWKIAIISPSPIIAHDINYDEQKINLKFASFCCFFNDMISPACLDKTTSCLHRLCSLKYVTTYIC